MSTYPPDGWTMVTGTWGTQITHSATGGAHGGSYIEFDASTITAAEIESTNFFPVNISRYYDVSVLIAATGTTNLGTHQLFVDWYNSSESLVSTTTVSTITLGATHGSSTREGAQVAAPSTGCYAKLRLKQNVDTGATSDKVRVYDVTMTLAPAFWQASRITSDQTGIATTTWTDIVYNSEVVANACSLATGTGIVTVREPGCYYITAAAAVLSLDDGKYATLGLSINGDTSPPQATQIPVGAAGTMVTHGAWMARLSAQDTVRIKLYHNHGSNRDIVFGGDSTWFHGVRCGM